MRRRYYALGALLMLTGVLGFLLPSPLFGVLPVILVHHVAHVVAGATTVFVASRGLLAMRMGGRFLGAGFAVLAAAGFVMDGGTTAWLHVGVALVFLYHALLAPPTL